MSRQPRKHHILIGDRVKVFGNPAWWVVTRIVSPTQVKAALEDPTHVTIGKSVTINVSMIEAVRPFQFSRARTVWLVYQHGKSNKFWTLRESGNALTTTWGRIGTAGMFQTKNFRSDHQRALAADVLVAQKLAKGYVTLGRTAAVSPDELSQQLVAYES